MTVITRSRLVFPPSAYPDRSSCRKYVPGSTFSTLNWPASSVTASYWSRPWPEPPRRLTLTLRIPCPPGSCTTLPCTVLVVSLTAGAVAPGGVCSCPAHIAAHRPAHINPKGSCLRVFKATSGEFSLDRGWQIHFTANVYSPCKSFESYPESPFNERSQADQRPSVDMRAVFSDIDGTTLIVDFGYTKLRRCRCRTSSRSNTSSSSFFTDKGRKCWNSRYRSVDAVSKVDEEIERLVVPMARENPSWAYDRIVSVLAHLGHRLSDQTVGNRTCSYIKEAWNVP